MFKTPPTAKITPIKEICDVNHNVESKGSLRASLRSAKGNTFSNVQSTSTPIGAGKENADVTKDIQKTKSKQGLHTLQFPGLSTVKSALTHVGQVRIYTLFRNNRYLFKFYMYPSFQTIMIYFVMSYIFFEEK